MGRPRNPNTGMVFEREAVVVIVGAKPPIYDQVEVTDYKTGARVMINKDAPRVEAVEGIPYAFKPYQRVPKSHPAVAASPGSFLEYDELDSAELELVVS